VTQYFRSLRPHWTGEVEYFTVGSRTDDETAPAAAARLIRDTWNFCRRLSSGDYDVVHLNPSIGSKAVLRDGALLLIARLFRKRIVVFAHGWYEGFERKLRGSRIFASVANRADAFVVLGSEFASRLRRLGYTGKVFIQAVPVDDELLKDAARIEPRPNQSEFCILFLARLIREKGVYEALAAYRLLKTKYPFVRLVMAGDGPELNNLKAACADGPVSDVSFPGHVSGERKCAAFRGADAYLFPSHSEGLPISVLEAMSYGLPVVTSRVGALSDFFIDGEMGFMVESPEPVRLAASIERFIRDQPLTAKIRSFNQRYAADHFAASRIRRGLEKVYQSVLERAD